MVDRQKATGSSLDVVDSCSLRQIDKTTLVNCFLVSWGKKFRLKGIEKPQAFFNGAVRFVCCGPRRCYMQLSISNYADFLGCFCWRHTFWFRWRCSRGDMGRNEGSWRRQGNSYFQFHFHAMIQRTSPIFFHTGDVRLAWSLPGFFCLQSKGGAKKWLLMGVFVVLVGTIVCVGAVWLSGKDNSESPTRVRFFTVDADLETRCTHFPLRRFVLQPR